MHTQALHKIYFQTRNKGIKAVLGLLSTVMLLVLSCKEAYEPPAIRFDISYLVVDGFINASPNGKTTINLSRTRNLIDTITTIPELNAQVSIEAQTGGSYALSSMVNGAYSNPGAIPITTGGQYRLIIVTHEGTEYASDFVTAKETPLIDSLNWQQEGDVTVYVNTHDPKNQSQYYRWDYAETWEYHSTLSGSLGLKNGLIFYFDSTNRTDKCWSTTPSTNIVTGTSVKLSQDKIDHLPVAFVPQNSEKIGIRYSILVSQYTLTEDAYNYLQILQKNTQQVGSLFDPQPSQLKGNIHCLTNPAERVIGFVSASTVQSKRIFISGNEVTNWVVVSHENDCSITSISQNPVNYLMYDYPDTTFAPYYFVTPGTLRIAKKPCVDCTTRGGSNQKPSFW